MLHIEFENRDYVNVESYDDREDLIEAIKSKQDWVYLHDLGIHINLHKVIYIDTVIEEKGE